MLANKRLNPVIRTIAGTVACVFLWQQIVWAGDLIDNTLERLNGDQSQTFAPSYIQTQQSLHQDIIDQKQAIEDYSAIQAQTLTSSSPTQSSNDSSIALKGPIGGSSVQSNQSAALTEEQYTTPSQDSATFFITTESGDVIYYRGSEIESVIKKGGAIIRSIRLNEDGNLINAEILRTDGAILTVEDGTLKSLRDPNGVITNYDYDGRIKSQILPNGEISSYSYQFDETNNIVKTVITASDYTAEYDKDLKLQKVTKKDNTVIEYDRGIVAKITKSDGSTYIFGRSLQDASEVRATTYIGKDGYTVIFDAAYNILSITSPPGTTTTYIQNKPILTQNTSHLITYNDKGEPVYRFESSDTKYLADSIIVLANATKERIASENVLIDRQTVLDNATKARTSASTIYTDALLKFNNAVRARQARERVAFSPADYKYSKDKITIIRGSGLKEYDPQGRLITNSPGNGIVTTYTNKNIKTVQTTYDSFDSKESSLLNASLISDGKLYIKEDSRGIDNAFNKATYGWGSGIIYKPRSSMPIYSIDFSVDNQNPGLCIGLKSKVNIFEKPEQIMLVATSSNIVIRTYKNGLSTVAVPILNFKVNTEYTVQFEVGARDIKLYIWEKSGQKPTSPNYIMNEVTWNTGFFGSINKGAATFDNYSISEVVRAQQPDNMIAALWLANEKENTARTAFNMTKEPYEGALSSENTAQSAYNVAANTLKTAQAKEATALIAKSDTESKLLANRISFSNLQAGQTDYMSGTYVADPSNLGKTILNQLDFSYIIYNNDNAVKEIGAPDGSKVTYDKNGLPDFTIVNGNKTDYSYLIGASGEIINAEINRTSVKAIYNFKGNLSAIVTQDNARVEYNGGDVASIITANGVKQLYRAGRLSELVDKDGSHYIFDSNGKPVRGEDKYGNVYDYIYSIDPQDSKEITIINDPSHGIKRYYKNDLLLHTEDVTGLVSDNVYFDYGKLKEVIVKKYDVAVIQYDYVYKSDGTTEVKDNEGSTRIYSSDGKLAFLSDKNSHLYQYTYPDSQITRVGYITPVGQAALEKLPDDFVITQEFVNNKLKKVYKLGGAMTAYTDTAKPDYISDAKGEMIVDYDYDSSDDLISVTMCAARRNLVIASDTAKNKINDNKEIILAAIQKKVDDFSLYYMKTNFSRFTSKDPVIVRQALEDSCNASKPIKDEAAKARQQTEDQTNQQLAKIKEETDRLLLEIAKQEVTPLIIYYYRATLGRDPDSMEIKSWLSIVSLEQQKTDKNEIIKSILVSSEYNIRKAQVEKIKSNVRISLESYLKLTSQEEKNAYLANLGLTQQDVVKLNPYDINTILKWVDSQNLHFGQSAFTALKNLLNDNGTGGDLEDIATNVILIDVLTGAISALTNGDLQLSMYGLSKYAESKGLTLYNETLNFDDLTLQMNSGTQRVIAHVDGNHYIVITKIENDNVYYREETRGPAGTDEVMSKDVFLKKWSGNVITKTKVQDEKKILSAYDAKKIKGAFFWFIIPLIAAVISAVTAVVTAAAAIIASVISVAASVISSIAGIMASIGVQLASGISAVLGGISAAVGNVFGASIVGAAVKTLAGVGLSLGISTGMQALGINSTISNLTASFLTGGILGLLNPVAGMSMFNSFISEGLKYATISGINELGPKLQLDPNITSILSMTAGSLVGGLWQGKLGETIINIAPNIAGEFTYYGVTKLGEAVGIDPRISYLAGIGIRSSLQAGLSSNMNPRAMWNSVVNDLLRGGTSIGLQWTYQELDMDPILGSLSAAALTGAIEGLLEGQSAIKGVYDTLFKTGKGLLTLGGSENNAWAQAAYISQVLDFSRIIQERGIVDALETYASGFLHQSAIDNIWKMGGIADLVTNKAEVVVNEEGTTVKRIYINPERTDFIDFSLAMDDMVGYKQGNILVDCPIEIGPDGYPTTDNGKVKVLLGGKSRIVYNIKDHNLILVEYIDSKGETIAFAQPLDGEKSIKMNEDNNSIRTGRFYNREKQMIVDKRDNQVFRILSTPRSDMTDTEIQELIQNGVEGRYLDGVTIEYDKNSNQIKLEINPNAQQAGEFEGKTTFLDLISVNGISNEFGKYTPPTYEQRLKYRLSSQGVDENAIYLLPMFDGKGLPLPVRVIKDSGLWLLDNAGANILTSELIAKLDREIYGDILPGQQYEPKIMTLFSGSTNSFFKAINKRHDYIIRDAIVLGGPTLDGMFEETTVTNPHLDRVFNVWGTKDMFYPVIANKKYSSNVTPYNIEILGASHSDYFYDPTRGSLNARSSYFVEKLLARVYTNGDVQSFLNGPGVTYDNVKKKYIVDPYAIDYDPGLEWRNDE